MINVGKSSLSPISPPLGRSPIKFSAPTKGKLEPVNGKPGIVESGRLLKEWTYFPTKLYNQIETSINHLKSLGIVTDTFGSTLNMAAENLIWVVCWLHVEVDYYPSWGDVVQVEAWMYRSGRNGFRRDWLIRDLKTGKTLIRATSLYAMMNKKTRKFAKLNEEVIIADLKPFFTHCDPLINKDSRKFLHLDNDNADDSRTGLNPGWMEMDANQHVSHIKLVNYVLEGVPRSFVESHELCVMTLEYRKECNVDSVLQSLSKISGNDQLDR
ncbi:hypothetical protein Pint_29919 [Pistacia integerrima]|uniref:Uncharacterized protein n=1 Tax=Pistacia integerrima TaxID=434235 RepID=A0ACC0WX34_9ROSI|nr:hypothetical protein Pint_29919 [Pistacia integerrima]